jgi:hypothetical protein
VRRLLVVLLVVVGLLVALDRVAVLAAERVVATRIQTDQSLPERPDVSIGGFPFLTQAIAGRYGSVTLTVHDLHRTVVPVHTLTVHLTGVHVPLSSVIRGHVSSVPVDRASASVLLNGDVMVKASATVAGFTVGGSLRAHVEVKGSDLVIAVNGLDLTIPLAGLPFRIALVGAKATKAGVVVTGTAAGLVLHPRE